ncbi:MAG: DUF2220 family protein [Lachnospiraceae bacterium]|nr:DUF2220 family protein [Lachnospiraceae bacterium]
MKRKILNELLDQYERSKLFREGSSARRVMLQVSANRKFAAFNENADEKEEFLAALSELTDAGLTEFSWVRFEKGNLVDRVFLVTDEEAVARSYSTAGRVPLGRQLDVLGTMIRETLVRMNSAFAEEHLEPSASTTDIQRFLLEEIYEIEKKKSLPRYFFHGGVSEQKFESDCELNGKLLLFLETVDSMTEDELERVISTRLYGDSKYFEREMRSKVLQILRQTARNEDREVPDDEELLKERGVVKWPEILEFCGSVKVTFENDGSVDYSALRFGAYINSGTVRAVSGVELVGISRIISIENKANYTWYVENAADRSELVLYHGGCFSPAKGRWFSLIAAESEDIPVYHWSDIDLGGFRIFTRLRKEIFPQALPWRMDVKTLEEHRDRCIPLPEGGYRKKLEAIAADPEYACFAEVIRYMLDEGVRLEQEAEV